MAKRIPLQAPEWLGAPTVRDVYAVSSCVNDDVLDVARSEQNGFGLFNSEDEIRARAADKDVDLQGTRLFYYEAYELEFDETSWFPVVLDEAYETRVKPPMQKRLEGFDVVSGCDGPNSHSPLSCNSIAADVRTNEHCLFDTEQEAINNLNAQAFKDCEPGPYKIYAVYSVDWKL